MLEILITNTIAGIRVSTSIHQHKDGCYFKSPRIAIRYVHAVHQKYPEATVKYQAYNPTPTDIQTLDKLIQEYHREKPNINYD